MFEAAQSLVKINVSDPLLKRWAAPVGIFLLALIIRALTLGVFVTADEPLWIERTRWFTIGLFATDLECPPMKHGRLTPTTGLACTLQSGHPGVTTMWGGSLGLLAYYWQNIRPTGVDLSTFLQTPLESNLNSALVMWVRMPLVIVAALFTAIFYVLARRLFDTPTAVVATLLLSLHPVHIALSRVLHHDALNTTFTVLSALALIGYWLRGWSWRWLLFSAMMAGFAFLGKPISLLLFPYTAFLGGMSLIYCRPRSIWLRLGQSMLWVGIALLTFALFFPAVWVTPGQVVAVLAAQNVQLVESGHSHYFLGQVSDDPGWWFYPVNWLWQASPLEQIGLLGSLAAAVHSLRLKRWANYSVEIALVLFIILLLLLETLSDKKMFRYFLPAFPLVAILAARGLLWLTQSGTQRFFRNWSRWTFPGLVGLIIAIQGGLALLHHPYYFTYYNPLWGGPSAAAQVTTVGWGEGMEQAAHYLNNLPHAETLSVSSWYSDIFQPYFVGRKASFADDGRAQLAADYVVFYISQIQRQKPYPGLINYFRGQTPVFVVAVNSLGEVAGPADEDRNDSVNWVEVYKAPRAQSAGGAPEIEGVAQLLAYKITDQERTNRVSDRPSERLFVTLFFKVLGPLPEETDFGIALTPKNSTTGAENSLWGRWVYQEAKGEWVDGEIVEWQGNLTLPPDMPDGEYGLRVAFQFQDGKIIAELPISHQDPPVYIQ